MGRNIDNLIKYVKKSVDEHCIETGKYSRFLSQESDVSSEYGCADAANILYTIGMFPRETDIRDAFVTELRRFQKDDGCYCEPTHHTLHTTAHCIAALELFDALPVKNLSYHIENFGTEEKMIKFLSGFDNTGNPWNESHKGAGMYAAMVLTGNMSLEMQNAYFKFISDNADSNTGIGFRNAPGVKLPYVHHLAGWFHYMFNFLYARRPFPYAEKTVDTCLDLYINDLKYEKSYKFGSGMGFIEIDWIFLINRASMQTGYRRGEVIAVLREFAGKYVDYLERDIETGYKEKFNDMHALFGTMCAVAELQSALPGELVSSVPLKNVLERRPFI